MKTKLFFPMNKTKDYIFLRRKPKTEWKFWLMVVVVILLLGLVGKMELSDRQLRQQIRLCQQTNSHIWLMDKSCSEQLMNSHDGILRIKTK